MWSYLEISPWNHHLLGHNLKSLIGTTICDHVSTSLLGYIITFVITFQNHSLDTSLVKLHLEITRSAQHLWSHLKITLSRIILDHILEIFPCTRHLPFEPSFLVGFDEKEIQEISVVDSYVYCRELSNLHTVYDTLTK